MCGARATVRVQAEPFDAQAESEQLTAGRTDIGAVVTFAGLCRDEGGTLAALEIEHYPGMAEEEIFRVAGEAWQRWPLKGLTAVHRYRTHRAGRADRAGRRRLHPSRRRFRGGRIFDGLPQDAARPSGRRNIAPTVSPATGSRRKSRTTRRRNGG